MEDRGSLIVSGSNICFCVRERDSEREREKRERRKREKTSSDVQAVFNEKNTDAFERFPFRP